MEPPTARDLCGDEVRWIGTWEWANDDICDVGGGWNTEPELDPGSDKTCGTSFSDDESCITDSVNLLLLVP